MRSICATALAAAIVAAALYAPRSARAADDIRRTPARHLVVTNATFDSITGLSMAADGSGAYQVIDLGEPLQGGETSVTVEIPRGGCLRAVRVTFRKGYSRNFPHFDLCSSQHLRLTTAENSKSG